MWFGTDGGGVSSFDGKAFRTYDTRDGLVGTWVKAILQDRKGVMWFATGGGGVGRFGVEARVATPRGAAPGGTQELQRARRARRRPGARAPVPLAPVRLRDLVGLEPRLALHDPREASDEAAWPRGAGDAELLAPRPRVGAVVAVAAGDPAAVRGGVRDQQKGRSKSGRCQRLPGCPSHPVTARPATARRRRGSLPAPASTRRSWRQRRSCSSSTRGARRRASRAPRRSPRAA